MAAGRRKPGVMTGKLGSQGRSGRSAERAGGDRDDKRAVRQVWYCKQVGRDQREGRQDVKVRQVGRKTELAW